MKPRLKASKRRTTMTPWRALISPRGVRAKSLSGNAELLLFSWSTGAQPSALVYGSVVAQ